MKGLYAEFQLPFLIRISLDAIVLKHCQRIKFCPILKRFMIPWFTSASARTWEKPSASGYFLCICSVSDVQVHSIAVPCKSSSVHSSSHKPTNCHSTTKQAELPNLNRMGTCDFEYIHRQNDVSRAPHLADLLTAPEATWRKCCAPCSCCRLQRHALSSQKSQQGLVLCGTAGLHLHARSQPGWVHQQRQGELLQHSNLCTQLLSAFPSHKGWILRRIRAVTVATVESQQHIQLNENLIPLSSYLKVIVWWGEVSFSPQ